MAFFYGFSVFHGGTAEIFFENLIVVACVIETTLTSQLLDTHSTMGVTLQHER